MVIKTLDPEPERHPIEFTGNARSVPVSGYTTRHRRIPATDPPSHELQIQFITWEKMKKKLQRIAVIALFSEVCIEFAAGRTQLGKKGK